MTDLQLAYGRDFQTLSYDEGRFTILGADSKEAPPLNDPEIREALSKPIESPALEDLVNAGESVLIVVSDATRATASGQILNLLVRQLIQNGVAPFDIAIIFATGIHRPVSDEAKIELLTPFISQRIKTLNHDAYDSSQMITLGTTTRGTPVELNRALKDFDHVILTGGISYHYFAGFTGGRKSLCPGLASARTIEATHMLALDFETGGRRQGVGTGLLSGNLVHEECDEIAEMLQPTLSINTTVNGLGRAAQVFAGHWRAAHREACQRYLADHSIEFAKKRPVVIVSCGGFPYDINMIQAHKSLEMAAHACREGGAIVLLAECVDGLGRSDFLKWFSETNSQALAQRLRHSYEVNGQTAWALLTKTERFDIYLISKLPDDQVRQMRMTPAASLTDALKQIGGNAPGFVMPSGARFLPVIRK